MRVLGLTDIAGAYGSRPGYVVEVSEDELRMVADKAAYRDEFPKLKPGQEYPLSEGYNFRSEIAAATKAMQTAYASFQKASETMTRFAALMAEKEDA